MVPSLAVLLVTAGIAAPVPKGESEAERVVKLFGTPVDPDRDCTFKLAGKTVVVTVPDTPHTLTAVRQNAPRLLRPVRGDFAARVRVECRLPPGCRTCAAGLVALQDVK